MAGLQLTVTAPPQPLIVHIDRGMWEKIVVNLVANAIKFTPSGGRISVEFEASAQVPNRLRFVVSDTGAGIPDEAQELL